ncbi:MAG TPA: hypothetical protein PK926_05540 [Spirochaetota bacterium]|mgnify:CR=1 FL=1|nr:hypothetical protein [Spirochaetota bacterium]HPI89252.1 hypothetical protein [Spirochaetota bacterium]HPR48588.1 hypothetical protein [Spirochaetota bacterium]
MRLTSLKFFRRIFFALFSVILFVFYSSCSVEKSFSSKDDLARTVVSLLHEGGARKIRNMLVDKDDYIKNMHSLTSASNPEYGMNGEDYWRIFIGQRRLVALDSKAHRYEGKIIKLVKTGEPSKSINCGPFVMHRKIPLTLIVEDRTQQSIQVVDDEILGIVIEQDGRFRLFNIFR